jgi:hypothetical protein
MNYIHRPNLPAMPERIRRLRISSKGYPAPYFVADVDGVPDFRVVDPVKLYKAVEEHRCWICGDELGVNLTFTIGPMFAINRASAEPPSHKECAEWSARVCPFLLMPKTVRRDANLPDQTTQPAGIMVERNPGVTLLWTTKKYKPVRAGNGVLLRIGEPHDTTWYAEGRLATHEQVMEAMESEVTMLGEMAQQEGQESMEALVDMYIKALTFVPPAPEPSRIVLA